VDTTVVLEITSSDVVHSWWIPKLGGKADAVPGHTNETWFKIPADKAGETFRGQCAELCGPGHADMRAVVKAVTPEEYQSWADSKADAIEQSGKDLSEQRKQGEGQVIPDQ
jgi:cytochrome c oxidase subunit II